MTEAKDGLPRKDAAPAEVLSDRNGPGDPASRK